MSRFIMALDAGTTSILCAVFDKAGKIVGQGKTSLSCVYPELGWVEQDPNDILNGVKDAVKSALIDASCTWDDIIAIGIANQRETTVLWDRFTGIPIHNAISWQCKRTMDECIKLDNDYGGFIHSRTGLKVDSYFSATKIRWILDNSNHIGDVRNGKILFGTIDTWIIWNLTDGNVHATDPSNASRTMLFNINTMDWDDDILEILNIPRSILPEVRSSDGDFGLASCFENTPIRCVLGDQQAALFGQRCFVKGDSKCTYGTGGFFLMNTGNKPVMSECGLISTVAWKTGEEVTYALEGSVYSAGDLVEWAIKLGLANDAENLGLLAQMVKDSGGCYFVPAFCGLGAPYWNRYAKGMMVGITHTTCKSHILRAVLESAPFRINDILVAAEHSDIHVTRMKIDGGMSSSDIVAQVQANISNIEVIRTKSIEATVRGAAYMAGMSVDYWSLSDIDDIQIEKDVFFPSISEDERAIMLRGWERAMNCVLFLANEGED